MTTAPSPVTSRAAQLDAAAVVVAGLTALAFVLRLTGIDESLFGDELYTFDVVTQPGPSDVIAAMERTENTPPLFYLLAWLSGELRDPTVSIRLPSLLAGAATVPVVYLLGLRALDRTAGLVAAAFFALSPFAIFFGSEARAYALVMLLSALSTLVLLIASEERRHPWWIAYAICAALAIYTHYTAVLVVAAQAGWAVWFHRDRLRELVFAYAAVALAALAWLPYYLDRDTPPLSGFKALGAPPFSLETAGRELVASLVGHPFVSLRAVPGTAALVLLGSAGALALFGSLATRRRPRVTPGVALVAAVAVATPLGAALYSVFGTDIFYARNLSASLPGLILVLAAVAASLRRPLLLATVALALAGLVAGVVSLLDPDNGRPPFRDAASWIDERARPGDPVIQLTFGSLEGPLGRAVPVHFDRPHDVFTPGINDDRVAWARGARGARVFLVVPQVGALAGVPRRSGPRNGFVLRAHEIFPGFTPVGVFEYVRP